MNRRRESIQAKQVTSSVRTLASVVKKVDKGDIIFDGEEVGFMVEVHEIIY